MEILKLTRADAMIDAALAERRKRNFSPLAVAVLDAGRHMVAFKREDGAGFARFDIAYGKAWGALGKGFGTWELLERAAKFPAFVASISTATRGRIIHSPGGVLIVDPNDQILRAVGISGDIGDNDELCAIAGIESVGLTAIPGLPPSVGK